MRQHVVAQRNIPTDARNNMAKKLKSKKTTFRGSKRRAVSQAGAKTRSVAGKRKVPVIKPSLRRVGKVGQKAAVKSRAAQKKASSSSSRRRVLSASERKKMRSLLMKLRQHITGQINFLATDNLSRTQADAELDFKSEEQGTDNFDRDLALSRLSVEQNAIFEIDQALHRIDLGLYGVCEYCQKPIEKARLMALPYSRLCVACQAVTEKSGVKRSPVSESGVFGDMDAAGADVESEEEK